MSYCESDNEPDALAAEFSTICRVATNKKCQPSPVCTAAVTQAGQDVEVVAKGNLIQVFFVWQRCFVASNRVLVPWAFS